MKLSLQLLWNKLQMIGQKSKSCSYCKLKKSVIWQLLVIKNIKPGQKTLVKQTNKILKLAFNKQKTKEGKQMVRIIFSFTVLPIYYLWVYHFRFRRSNPGWFKWFLICAKPGLFMFYFRSLRTNINMYNFTTN